MYSRFIKKHGRSLFCLLLVAIVLRSFVAPGYMFDFGGNSDSGFAIIPCPGPGGINAVPAMDDPHHSHDHSGPDHDQAHSSDSSICGLLHVSSTFIKQLDLSGELSPQYAGNYYPARYNEPRLPDAFYRVHSPRAPPVLSLI